MLFRNPNPTGPVEVLHSTHRTKAEAERVRRLVEAEVIRADGGHRIADRRQPFGRWAERWFDSLTVKPSTAAGYRSIMDRRILPQFGTVPIGSIRPIDVESWSATMHRDGVGASQRAQTLSIMSGIMSAAVRNDIITTNPVSSVRKPATQPRTLQPLTVAEVVAVADGMPGPWIALVHVMGFGGLRIGEVFALRRRSVDGDVLHITESVDRAGGFGPPKSNRPRDVIMPATLTAIVGSHMDTYTGPGSDALLFTNDDGERIGYWGFRRRFARVAVDAIGRHVTPHDLRHTAASLMIAAGADPSTVQAQLGHADIGTTFGRYGHLFGDQRQRAAARMDAMIRGEADNSADSPAPGEPPVPGET